MDTPYVNLQPDQNPFGEIASEIHRSRELRILDHSQLQ